MRALLAASAGVAAHSFARPASIGALPGSCWVLAPGLRHKHKEVCQSSQGTDAGGRRLARISYRAVGYWSSSHEAVVYARRMGMRLRQQKWLAAACGGHGGMRRLLGPCAAGRGDCTRTWHHFRSSGAWHSGSGLCPMHRVDFRATAQ